jgi:hypothetical protein
MRNMKRDDFKAQEIEPAYLDAERKKTSLLLPGIKVPKRRPGIERRLYRYLGALDR